MMEHHVTRQVKLMMIRKNTIIMLIGGIILGAAATEGFDTYCQSHNSHIFQERLHCKVAADAYVKENSTDFKEDPDAKSAVTVTLDKVDYSPARNSCIAELETTHWFQQTILESSSVRDLLSGQSLFSTNYAGDSEVVKTVYTDPAFDYVIKNASEPIKQEKAYAYYLAHSDTKGNPIPDSKHPPSGSILNTPLMSPSSRSKASAKRADSSR